MQSEYIKAKESEGYLLYGTEVPYNSGRGFIDVVMSRVDHERKQVTWTAAELKTSLRNLGETIRQVRRAQQFFVPGNADRLAPGYPAEHRFPLVVWATDQNWRQCASYWKLLSGIELEFFHTDHAAAVNAWNMYEIAKAIAQAAEPTPEPRDTRSESPDALHSVAALQSGNHVSADRPT